MIGILDRNLSFFRLLRNNNITIESVDLDSQFGSVIDYLNDVIVPAVNNMQAQALPGINGSANYFLTNVGDGSVTFSTLAKVIPNSSIEYTKLIKLGGVQRSGFVITTNNTGIVTGNRATNPNMLLTYVVGSMPEYRFVNTNSIEDRSVTYADIADGAITNEHLHQEIIDIIDAAVPDETAMENVLLTGNQFQNLSITTDKFTPNTINSESKLGVINNTLPELPPNQNKIITRIHIKNGTITPAKIKPNTIGALHFNKAKCITRNKLASNIIDDSFLRLKNESYNIFDINNQSRFWFYPRILANDFLIKREHLKVTTNESNHCCRASDFETEVMLAFNRFGCT